MLRAPTSSAAASFGYSMADLEAEVASLQRQQAASLLAAQSAAEAAAAAATGAEVVREQCLQRQAGLAQRVQAKQQAAAMLSKHLARQLLIAEVLQREQAVLHDVQATLAAALADGTAALQAAQERMPGYAQGQQHQEGGGGPAAAGQKPPMSGVQDAGERLLACRAQLQHLQHEVLSQILPAQHAVLAQLAGLLYDSDGVPQVSAPELQQQLAAARQAHDALLLQAGAMLDEVAERSQASSERKLAEDVLVHFWGDHRRLEALVADKDKDRQPA